MIRFSLAPLISLALVLYLWRTAEAASLSDRELSRICKDAAAATLTSSSPMGALEWSGFPASAMRSLSLCLRSGNSRIHMKLKE